MSSVDLSTLFEHLPIGAYRIAPNGSIWHVNAALLRLNGYASENEMRRDVGEVVPNPYAIPARRQEFLELLYSRGSITNFESEMVRYKSGEHWWAREHAHTVRDEDGNLLYYEGTIEDITSERAAQFRLDQRESLLYNVLQTIPDHVWLKDTSGVYVTCNEAFAERLKIQPAALIGTRDADWVGEEIAQQFLTTDQLVMRTGTSVTFEEGYESTINPKGELHEVVKTPMRDGLGNIIGVLGMARSIQQRKDAEALLRDTTEQLELAIMGADLGRWNHDLTHEKGYFLDERACKMLGRDPRESEKGRAWGHLIHPDDLTATLQAMRAHLSGHADAYEVDYRARHTDGHWIWLSSRGKVVQFDREGNPQRMVGTLMDISGRKQAEAELRATQSELQATLNALPDQLFELSADGRYRAVHSREEEDTLYASKFILNKVVTEVLPKDAAEAFLSALNEAQAKGRSTGHQYRLDLAPGKQWFELTVVRKPTEPGEEERFIAIARDITERKITEEAIQHLAFHDSLTGLPNRRLFNDRLHSALIASHRQQQHGALMFLDLDKFKQLNDTHGHDIGDLMLQEVSRRLLQNIRAVDTVARLGGDEFVVLVQALSADEIDARMHASTVGHKILASMNEPYWLNGRQHTTTPSIGIALFSGEVAPPNEILKQADIAMYHAKALGRNTLCFYDPDMPITHSKPA
ncbi:sensor domain-containing diguanylate cyclase [Rhodoferax aquaticus]|uniref:Sensor domain-containing diguanylate cyclase n=1 Tax=Rhodoferax aquaticus TaxID=2527691 RepID=A0A515EPA7_9BURK|nr:sensor domain-containing diguanylate cyclase [Rhodoferax aquaticus]QDL54506.1 sensor domain-containing diguanylate cyclase [Rhodoferax aquaticus]